MKSVHEYVLDKVYRTEDRVALEALFYQIVMLVDADALQDIFQDEMDEDKFFDDLYPDPCYNCDGDITNKDVDDNEAFICPNCDNIFCPLCTMDCSSIMDERYLPEFKDNEYYGKRLCDDCMEEIYFGEMEKIE